MFENEIAINETLMRQFLLTIKDIPDEEYFHPSSGHGHPAVWIVGHLTIVGELGLRMLGGKITHRSWVERFGPGSSDIVSPADDLDKQSMSTALIDGYLELRQSVAVAELDLLNQPTGIPLFEGTSIKTIQHAIALILTGHFGFHLAQLSSCRRMAGYGPLA